MHITIDGPLFTAAAIVALVLGLLHLLFLPGTFGRTKPLPVPVSHFLGLSTILVALTFLAFGRGTMAAWRVVTDAWVLSAAGAVPTLGLRWLADKMKEEQPGQPMSDRQAHRKIEEAIKKAEELTYASTAQDRQVQ